LANTVVVKVFQEAGFKHAHLVPYPISAAASKNPAQLQPFSRVWFAGAARQDKGFSKVVDLIEYVGRLGSIFLLRYKRLQIILANTTQKPKPILRD